MSFLRRSFAHPATKVGLFVGGAVLMRTAAAYTTTSIGSAGRKQQTELKGDLRSRLAAGTSLNADELGE